jgi:hypothetical protein
MPSSAVRRGPARSARSFESDSDPNYRGKFLQVYFTVDDPNVFATPWSATITYRPSPISWGESVCSENPNRYFEKDTDVPVASAPDF